MLILLVLISFFTLTLVFENSALRTVGQWLDEVILSEMHSSTFPQEKKKNKGLQIMGLQEWWEMGWWSAGSAGWWGEGLS